MKNHKLSVGRKTRSNKKKTNSKEIYKPRKMNKYLLIGKIYGIYIDKILFEIINSLNMNNDIKKQLNDEQQINLIEHINKLKPKLITYKTIENLYNKLNCLSMWELKKELKKNNSDNDDDSDNNNNNDSDSDNDSNNDGDDDDVNDNDSNDDSDYY